MNQTATIEQTRVEERERELAYYRFEEATDVAERMGYPNDHTLEHDVQGEKIYDSKGVAITDYTKNGLKVAEELLSGPDLFEVDIRRVEHKNIRLLESVVRGEQPGNAMIEYGPCPDDICDNKPGVTVKGYRGDLRRDIVRFHWIEGKKAKCRIVTLDNATVQTRDRVGKFLAIPMPPGQPSIQALDNPHITSLNAAQIDELVNRMKLIHDHTLAQEKGGTWHAGSLFADKQDALSLVLKHSDLLDQHMTEWSKIVGIAMSKDEMNQLMEQQRRQTPAAIVKRERGEWVDSTSDPSVAHEADTGNYEGYCADLSKSGSVLGKMGMNQGVVKTISKHCPICGAANITTIIEGGIISGEECGCWREICGTKMKHGTKLQSKQQDAGRTTEKTNARKVSDEQIAKRIYGEAVRVRTEIIVGGEKKAVYGQNWELLGYL